eukprot:GEMP01117680.1.p2 GENE.GEMP01117680.1~~GEMP01117680.1.p2  ORF type:complete len:114 (+),score=18.82 GEMP01117680.1:82-423(+)
MFGALRACLRAPAMRVGAPAQRFPLTPVDLVYRYFPNFSRDKVWYLYFHIASCCAFGGGMYIYSHLPFKGEHNWTGHSYYYKWVTGRMERSGTLEYNRQVRSSSFYPAEEEEE